MHSELSTDLAFSSDFQFVAPTVLHWQLVSFSHFVGRGWGGGSERGLGGLSSPQKPKNSRWSDMHSERSVGSFFTLWQVGFTANFAVKTSLFSFFLFFVFGGGGVWGP